MGKEHGEHGKQNSKKVEKFTDKIKREKKQGKEDADKIRPVLEKDPDWPLVSGAHEYTPPVDRERKSKAIVRLTKKAAGLLFPEFKALASRGRGTGRSWVHVNMIVPEKLEYSQEQDLRHRVGNMLEATGIKYSTYLTDYGRNDHDATCLSVEVNDFNWGHH